MSAPPDIDDQRACIGQLLALLNSFDSYSASGEHHRLAVIAHGWCTQVARFARAALTLIDADMSTEAHPLTRAALEYAITLHWLAQRGDAAVEAVLEDYERTLRLAAGDAVTGGLGDHLRDIATEISDMGIVADDEVSGFRRFEQVCKSMHAHDLYALYRLESGYVHPRYSTAALYVRPHNGGESYELTLAPNDDHASVVPALTACWLLWALRAYDDLSTDRPTRDQLITIADRLQVAPTLPPITST